MSGSPPQMETMGALHSMAESRHSSRLIMSLRLVEYSRIRPQPVQVRLQVCNGSSWSTRANLPVFFILLVMMCRAIFADNVNGNLIIMLLLVRNYQTSVKCASARKRATFRRMRGCL